ncbi:MAG: choice-of-anchor D domain-containing protein, partial [Verrucomicrobiales bacterium]|nr:choice-of-anchor D domain-containing protein [Verrucomicrobiales bacterium]
VAAGQFHSVAGCSDGTAVAWGYNLYGQIGNSANSNVIVPVAVDASGVLSGKTVVSVAAGYIYSLALCSDGTLAAWGYNAQGQLGNDSTTNSNVPVAVDAGTLAIGERFTQASGGNTASHNLALVAAPPPPPTVVTGIAHSITATSATLAGSVNAEGYDATVSFEYGTTTSYGTTVTAAESPVSGSSDTAVSAAISGLTPATTYHYRVLGTNIVGPSQGEDATFTTSIDDVNATYTTGNEVPVTVGKAFLSGATATLTLGYAPVAGTELTVIDNTGLDFIDGEFSNLAQGQTVTLSYGGVSYKFVANYYGGTGNDLVLAWKNTRAMAWGYNFFGQIGDSSTTNRLAPAAVLTSGVLAGKTVVDVAVGGYHCVALCSDGTLAAWGYNNVGQLGTSSTTNSSVPVAVDTSGVLSGKKVVRVAAGLYHSLAVCSDGTLTAWGYNSDGQLGIGSTTQSTVPVAVDTSGVLAGKTVVSAAAGNYHSVALCSDGTLAAWGANNYGHLGNGTTTQSTVPAAVDTSGVLAGKTVVAIAAGERYCAVVCSDGTAAGWGDNTSGQLGNNLINYSVVPLAVDTSGLLAGKAVVSIAAGTSHSVALCSDGTVAAWGNNSNGQLGNNSTTQSKFPVAVNTSGVLAGKTVVAVAAGGTHSMAVCSDGTMASWGYNGYGQLGNNSTTQSLVPVAVSTSTLGAGERFVQASSGQAANHTLALVATPPAAPEIAVSGNGVDITDGDTTPSTADHTDFGSAGVAGGSVARTFTITNSGPGDLTLAGTAPDYVTLSGAGAAHFSVTTQPSSATVISGGGTQTFTITFDPSTGGAQTATVSIANDDSDENPFTFDITGTGVPYTVTNSGGVLTITDGDGSVNGITIGVSGGNLILTDAGSGLNQSIPLAGLTEIVINPEGGDDTVTIGDLTGFTGSVTVNEGTGTDNVVVNGPVSTGGGGFTIHATGDITIAGSVQTGGGAIDLFADSDSDGSGDLIVAASGSLASGAGSMDLKGADMDLSGPVSGTSTLAIVPSVPGTTIGLGGGAGDFALSDAELGNLTDGFSSITIGNAGSGDIGIDTASFLDPLTLLTGGDVNDAAGTDLTLAEGGALSNGSVQPGGSSAVGELSVSGSLDLAGTLVVDINTTGTAGTDYDTVSSSGAVNLSGGLSFNNLAGYVPDFGDSFTLVSRTGGTGTFAGLPEGAVVTPDFLGSGRGLRITYMGGDGDDVVAYVPDPLVVGFSFKPTLVSGTDPHGFENATFTFRFETPDLFYSNLGGGAMAVTSSAQMTITGATNPNVNGTYAVVDNDSSGEVALAPYAYGDAFIVDTTANGIEYTFSSENVTVGFFAQAPEVTTPIPGDPVSASDFVGLTFSVPNFTLNSTAGNGTFSFTAETSAAAGPEIQVAGNSVDIASGDITPATADHTDFGATPVFGGTVVRTFTVSNAGSGDLNLTGTPKVAVSGTNAADFTVTLAPSTPIAGGAGSTFQVTFDPSALGVRTATLSIASDDSDENPFTFGIQGAAEDTTLVTQSYSVGGSSNSLTIPAGVTSLFITATGAAGGDGSGGARDGGSGAVMGGTFPVSGGDVLDVYVGQRGETFGGDSRRGGGGGGGSAVILNGTNVLVAAAGGGGGGRGGQGTGGGASTNSTPGGGTAGGDLGGAGGGGFNAAGTDVSGAGPTDATGGGAGTLTGIGAGGTRDTANIGGAGGAGWGGGGGSDGQGGGGGGGYRGGDGAANNLSDPQGSGGDSFFNTTLGTSVTAVAGTQGGANAQSNAGQGQVVISYAVPNVPEIAVSGNSVDIANGDTTPEAGDHTDFGSVAVAGGSVARTFTINNTGTVGLNLTGAAPEYVTVSGAGAAQFSVTTQPASATVTSGGGSQTFIITFDPSAGGAHTATVSIANDDGDENPFTFDITGNGIPYTVTNSGGVVTITDDTGDVNGITVSVSGGNLIITDAGSGLNQSIPLAGLTSLVINPGAGDDTVTIGDLTGFTGSVTVNEGTGTDNVVVNGPVSTGGGSFTVSATGDITIAGSVQTGGGAIDLFADSDTDGNGDLIVQAGAAAGWATQSVDTSTRGDYTSLAVVNGKPAISYYDVTNGDLKYVIANDASASTWGTPVTVDATGDVGQYTSLAVVDGKPAISYYDVTNGDLKYVIANDASGSTWGTPISLDTAINSGQYASLAVVDGNPAISYHDFDNGDLKYVRANTASGTLVGDWGTPQTLDSTGIVGQFTSLLVVNGNPAISYYYPNNADLKYVRADDASGTSWGAQQTLDSTGIVGLYTSMAIVDGNPAISYHNGLNFDLKYVRASDASGTSWGTPVTLDSATVVGQYTSLAVINGNPAISYYDDSTDDLKYIRANTSSGTLAGDWDAPETVESTGTVGQFSSLAEVNGQPAISYSSVGDTALKFARLQTATSQGSLASSSGQIDLKGAGMVLGGPVSGTNALTIAPSVASTTIGLGGGAGDFALDDTELGNLADGFSSITIGDTTSGTGTVTADTATFNDPITLAGGSIVDGAGTDLTLSPNAVLDGSVKPGGSGALGDLNASGALSLGDGSGVTFEVSGAATHDTITAAGAVNIGTGVTATFTSLASYTPTGGESFTLISRTGGTGTFDGLPEGALIPNFLGSGLTAVITYAGGDGDDVVVAVSSVLAAVDGSGNLIIGGGSGADGITVAVVGGNVVITDNTTGATTTIPLSSITGPNGITISPADGDDTVTIGDMTGYTGPITVDATTGNNDVVVNGPVNTGGADFVVTATGNITINGSVQTAGGAIDLFADSDSDGSGDLIVAAAGSLASGAGSMSLRGANMDLSGPVSGTSTLAIVPSVPGTTIGLGGVTGEFDLDDAELALITDGFSRITIDGDLVDTLAEDFSGGTPPAGFDTSFDATVGSPTVSFAGGNANFNGANDLYRTYVRSLDTGYYSRDFVAEITVTQGSWLGFFGMGVGTPTGGSNEPGVPQLTFRLPPGTGQVSAYDNVGGPPPFGILGDGTHRLRLTWNATAKTALFEVDKDYAGGPFVADLTSAVVDGSDNGFDATNSRIFFGGAAGMVFDDLTITTGGRSDIVVNSASFNDPVTLVGGSIVDGSGTDLTLSPDAVLDGSILPGGSGTVGALHTAGALELGNGSSVPFEFGGATAAGTDYDTITATGAVNIGTGVTATFTSLASYTPSAGDSFTLISRTGGTGTFDGLP